MRKLNVLWNLPYQSAGIALALLLSLVPQGPAPAQDRRGDPEDKAGREAWLLNQRALPGRAIPYRVLGEALLRESARLAPQDASVTWESLGPAPLTGVTMQGNGNMTYSGRALAVAVDPSAPQSILLGAAQGGIWRSTDGGAHFTAVADDMPSQAIKVIRFAPSDPSIVYAGSGEPHSKTSIFGMGVFKSLDGGATWDALPASGSGWDFRFLDVSGLQVDPANPDILYVTTANILGDRVDPFGPPPTAPPGIFKSTDGGMTWKCMLTANDYRSYDYPVHDPYLASGYGFIDLELWKANPQVLFAVERSGGIYRSTDAGEHWQLVTPVKSPGGGPAQGGDFPADVPQWHFYDGFRFTSYPVLKRPASTPEFNRIEMSIGQFGGGLGDDVSGEVLYAGYGAILQLDVNGNGSFDSGMDLENDVSLIFKSTDGGSSWTWLGDWMNGGTPAYCDAADSGSGGFENALYDNTVEVNPQDPSDVVVAGNVNYNQYWPDPVANPKRYLEIPWSGMVYRTLDGGANWMDITQACSAYTPAGSMNGLPLYQCTKTPTSKTTHPDSHCAFYDWPNRKIYLTNDGGLWVCTVSGDGTDGLGDYDWQPLNSGLSTLQFFNFGPHPTDPNKILGGMQDNTNAFWNGSVWKAWDWFMGDGNIGQYDPLEPRYVYLGCQYRLARHDNGGSPTEAGWKILFFGDADEFPFVTILAIDPVKSNIIYVGTMTGLLRSPNRGDSFKGLNRTPTDGQVTAISVSPANHKLVWAGTSTGRLYLFDTKKGKVYDKTGANLPNRWISGISASPGSAGGATIAFSGYDANSRDAQEGGNGNVGRVFRTADQGQSWTNVSGNMTGENGLDIPIASLAVDPADESQMWIGTDAGAFRTGDGGQQWESFRGNMPVVAVTALSCNRQTGYLSCATFGRGVWRTSLTRAGR